MNKVIQLRLGIIALGGDANDAVILPFEAGNFDAILRHKLALKVAGVTGRHGHCCHLRGAEFGAAEGRKVCEFGNPARSVLR